PVIAMSLVVADHHPGEHSKSPGELHVGLRGTVDDPDREAVDPVYLEGTASRAATHWTSYQRSGERCRGGDIVVSVACPPPMTAPRRQGSRGLRGFEACQPTDN